MGQEGRGGIRREGNISVEFLIFSFELEGSALCLRYGEVSSGRGGYLVVRR